MKIKFEDIRKGDKLRVSYSYHDTKQIVEGVADHKINNQYWVTYLSFNVATVHWIDMEIELLHRPDPDAGLISAVAKAICESDGGVWDSEYMAEINKKAYLQNAKEAVKAMREYNGD